MSILGESFDIHGGGDDLTFPHHQNEQAQASACGHGFARFWVHSAMLNVSGEKMSKSLGNFTTLAEALEAFGPRAVRLAVLQTHYRSTMEMGPESLSQTAEAVKRLDAMVRRAVAAGVTLASANPTVDVVLAFLLMVGGVAGAQYGTKVGQRLRGEQLRALLAALVLAVAIRLGYGLFARPDDIYSLATMAAG